MNENVKDDLDKMYSDNNDEWFYTAQQWARHQSLLPRRRNLHIDQFWNSSKYHQECCSQEDDP